jgi:hypothetical protein
MAFTIVGDAAVISGDCSNSRAAAVFTGGNTDDAYTCDAVAVARTAANDTAGTITAWVNPSDITSTMSIACFNDNNVVEFIDLRIVAGKLVCACTDATTAQFVLTTTNVVCPAHKWTHVAVVQDGTTGAKLYVNGVAVAQSYTTSTDVLEWFNNLDGVDNFSIGAGRIAGDGSYTEEFVGGISDVKYWASALTEAQIQQDAGNGYTTSVYFWADMNSLADLGSGAATIAAVSDVYMTPCYNEFISKVRKFGAVVADAAGFSEHNGRMSCLFINAA